MLVCSPCLLTAVSTTGACLSDSVAVLVMLVLSFYNVGCTVCVLGVITLRLVAVFNLLYK